MARALTKSRGTVGVYYLWRRMAIRSRYLIIYKIALGEQGLGLHLSFLL